MINYYLLTKPGIIFGNLITFGAGFLLASHGSIDLALFVATLLGLSLVIGAACVFNNYIDRDLDGKMERTKRRPLVQGIVSRGSALCFATCLFLLGSLILFIWTNPYPLLLSWLGFFIYVVIYSFWKSKTVYGTAVGSIAGALPPVIGYCAVSKQFDLAAGILFLMLVLWQMPHFFAISLYHLEDYKRANLPVLPLARGVWRTKVHMLLYVVAFVPTALALYFLHYAGGLYFFSVSLLGIAWVLLALRGFFSGDDTLWGKQMFRFSLLLVMVVCFTLPLHASQVCLNMIVKDEKEVIARALRSVKPLIDTWVIVDTGSTDGTQEIILEEMRGIPGELHERPWKNFAHNRNEALQLAKSKAAYLLFIDADEELQYPLGYTLPPLVEDGYFITIRMEKGDVHRTFLVKSSLNWEWKGVLHEAIDAAEATRFALLTDILNLATATDGHRTKDPEKFLKDIAVLEAALQDEPDHSRYLFYLGQSYLQANQPEKAFEAFKKRTTIATQESPYEVFWSYYMMGQILEFLGRDPNTFLEYYQKAFSLSPGRAEPVYKIASYYTRNQQPILGYALSKYALSLPFPTEIGFIDTEVYNHLLLVNFANSAALLQRYGEAEEAYNTLLERKLPEEYRQFITNRLLSKLALMGKISYF